MDTAGLDAADAPQVGSRLGHAAAHLVDLALVVDATGHLLELTVGAADALGWSEALVTGHWVVEVVHPDDQGRVTRHFSELEPGQTRRTDARLRLRDGEWGWYQLGVTNLIDDPLIGGLLVAVHDIGDRKRFEQELQRSEAYISSLVQHASDTILVLDAMVRIRFASPSAAGLFGIDPTRLLDTNVLDLLHPEDRESVADRFLDTAHSTGQTAYLDFRVLGADGHDRHVEAAATNLLDHPATNGIVVNLRDLAERDRAREVSELGERRFRKLIGNISDTITLVDDGGRVMMVTGAAREILGHPGGSWPGQSILDFVHPDDAERALALQVATLEHPGAEVSGQFRLRHADGSWVDVEATVVNLFHDPDVGGAVITSRNISSHKAIERALSHAHKQALDALAAKAEFVAQVGHEVRTPIHGIIGLAELLAESPLDEESRRLVGAILRSGESLGLVINDLLDFSKMEAGRLDLDRGVVSPHRLVADVVDMLRPQADDRGIALLGSLDAQTPVFVQGDELRLRQVLVNLLGNAVKYTDEGSVAVKVTMASQADDACVLRFEVSDTGVGIPAGEISRLFEPFTQASTTAALRRPGTGLGLSITRQLVELMGGEVSVSSQVGVGSTFSFTLPTALASPEIAPPSTRGRQLPRFSGRVLVVEDSPVNQALVERQLIRLGCEPVVASTGDEALVLMREVDLDLVLMDWQMPGMDGLETTRRWRTYEADRPTHLPIIAMTATAAADARIDSLAAGMDDFLAKPVKLDLLAEVLGRRLVEQEGGDSAGATRVTTFDRGVIERLTEEVGDPAIAVAVVSTFLNELDGRLAALRSSVVHDDRVTLERTAHTLRSTSSALGVDALASACGNLEVIARDETVDAEPLVAAVVAVAVEAAAALREHLAAQRSSG